MIGIAIYACDVCVLNVVCIPLLIILFTRYTQCCSSLDVNLVHKLRTMPRLIVQSLMVITPIRYYKI